MSFLNPESILNTLDIVKPGMRVGDLGCGAGYFSIALAQLVGEEGKVFAVDILENRLDIVKHKAQQLSLDNIDVIRADLENVGSTQLAQETLDVVFLVNVLFESEQKENILQESKRLLHKGGYLIIIDWDSQSSLGPNDHKVSKKDVTALAIKQEFSFDRDIETDPYHFGLLFRA